MIDTDVKVSQFLRACDVRVWLFLLNAAADYVGYQKCIMICGWYFEDQLNLVAPVYYVITAPQEHLGRGFWLVQRDEIFRHTRGLKSSLLWVLTFYRGPEIHSKETQVW
jgi:hypothetical protein